MSTCWCCGKVFDESEEEEIYDADDYIADHGLTGTYGNAMGLCANCAIEEAMSAYPQGVEDFS